MNEYLNPIAGIALSGVTGFLLGAYVSWHRRNKKSKLADRVSLREAAPRAPWSPVNRYCPRCDFNFWTDAGEAEYECPACGGKAV